MHRKTIDRLRSAQQSADHVRVERAHRYSDPVCGFVVAVGRKWTVLARTEDGGYFDGYIAVRSRSVRRVKRVRGFDATFSRSRPEWPGVLDQDFPADSTAEVLRDFSARSFLIGVEKERERSAMWIGEVDGIASKRVWLTEVRRDATWHAQPIGYRLRAITAVSIGTRYLRALAEVAGRAPQR